MAKKKTISHSEVCPPAARRFSHGASDAVDMQTTAYPLGSSHINTQPGNADCLNQDNAMKPVYSDSESAYIARSTTSGRK